MCRHDSGVWKLRVLGWRLRRCRETLLNLIGALYASIVGRHRNDRNVDSRARSSVYAPEQLIVPAAGG